MDLKSHTPALQPWLIIIILMMIMMIWNNMKSCTPALQPWLMVIIINPNDHHKDYDNLNSNENKPHLRYNHDWWWTWSSSSYRWFWYNHLIYEWSWLFEINKNGSEIVHTCATTMIDIPDRHHYGHNLNANDYLMQCSELNAAIPACFLNECQLIWI